MDSQHARFLSRLAESQSAVLSVAEWLVKSGRTVELAPLAFAPSAFHHIDYADNGDLFVIDRKRIEVKRISRDFSNASDWPFSDMLISNAAAVDRAKDVIAYITVSNNLSHCAVVETKTREQWKIVDRRARNTGNMERFYACPVGCAQFRVIK